jgi:hypothetical protein
MPEFSTTDEWADNQTGRHSTINGCPIHARSLRMSGNANSHRITTNSNHMNKLRAESDNGFLIRRDRSNLVVSADLLRIKGQALTQFVEALIPTGTFLARHRAQ